MPIEQQRPLPPDYPDTTTARADVACAAGQTRSWLDVVFDESHPDPGRVLRSGQRVQLEIVAPFGGQLDRTVARFIRHLGPGLSPPAPPAPPADGSNFRNALPTRSDLSAATCRVDFVSQLKRVSERQRRRYHYPARTTLRSDIRCLHPGGDSWLDAVFSASTAENALMLFRGARLPVAVVGREPGYGGHPVVRIPPPGFLDDPDAL